MVVCNGCGDLCAKPVGEEFTDDGGLIEAQVIGGYHSTELRDMTRYSFSLCEACLVRLFHAFKVPPTVEELQFSGDV